MTPFERKRLDESKREQSRKGGKAVARKFDGAPNRSWEGMSGSRYSDPMTLMVVRHGGRASMRSNVRKKRGSSAKGDASFSLFRRDLPNEKFAKEMRKG